MVPLDPVTRSRLDRLDRLRREAEVAVAQSATALGRAASLIRQSRALMELSPVRPTRTAAPHGDRLDSVGPG